MGGPVINAGISLSHCEHAIEPGCQIDFAGPARGIHLRLSPVMTLRVGTDLTSVQAVREAVRDHGDRYLHRIYTEAELRDCHTSHGIVHERLAARFAAKEATLKVLRPADGGIAWKCVEVVRHPSGWVGLELTGEAASIAATEQLSDFALSISHEGDYASAVVIAQRTTEIDTTVR
jgi:holo-[acyl-carrier protein] synthase